MLSQLYPNSKPVTISIPTNKFNIPKIKRSFMPNLIHSLDASNIHLLCNKLVASQNQLPLRSGPNAANNNILQGNIYTIHDCFATSPN